jgi:hypothetical protein
MGLTDWDGIATSHQKTLYHSENQTGPISLNLIEKRAPLGSIRDVVTKTTFVKIGKTKLDLSLRPVWVGSFVGFGENGFKSPAERSRQRVGFSLMESIFFGLERGTTLDLHAGCRRHRAGTEMKAASSTFPFIVCRYNGDSVLLIFDDKKIPSILWLYRRHFTPLTMGCWSLWTPSPSVTSHQSQWPCRHIRLLHWVRCAVLTYVRVSHCSLGKWC